MQPVWADLRRSGRPIEPTQWVTLRVIAAGSWMMSEQARHKAVSLPTMSKSVDMLARRGWVERSVGEADRRQTLVQLTAEGRQILANCRRQVKALLEDCLRYTPAGRTRLFQEVATMTIRRLAAVLGLTTLLSAPALAQRPMSITGVISVPVVSAPQLSPDGTRVVYVQADADWAANERVSHLWRVRLDGTGTVQLTSGKQGASQPRWSPDGQWVAFVGKRDGADAAQIQLLPMTGGESRALTAHATAASSPAWSPDGRFLYFLAEDAKSPEQLAREKARNDVYAFDETFQPRHLWRVDMATRTESRVTSGGFSILSYELSADGRRIAHHRAPSTVLGDAERGEVWVMDADGGNAVALTKNTVAESGGNRPRRAAAGRGRPVDHHDHLETGSRVRNLDVHAVSPVVVSPDCTSL